MSLRERYGHSLDLKAKRCVYCGRGMLDIITDSDPVCMDNPEVMAVMAVMEKTASTPKPNQPKANNIFQESERKLILDD